MSAELISDEDALYYARAWRRNPALDDSIREALFAWVRSMPPSRVLTILSERLTDSEVLALLDAVEKTDS